MTAVPTSLIVAAMTTIASVTGCDDNPSDASRVDGRSAETQETAAIAPRRDVEHGSTDDAPTPSLGTADRTEIDFTLEPLDAEKQSALVARYIELVRQNTTRGSNTYSINVNSNLWTSDRVWELRERIRARPGAQREFAERWFGGDVWGEYSWNTSLWLAETAGCQLAPWSGHLRACIDGELKNWEFAAMALGESGPAPADVLPSLMAGIREYDASAEMRHVYAAAVRLSPSDTDIERLLRQRIAQNVPFNGDPGDALYALAFFKGHGEATEDLVDDRLAEVAVALDQLAEARDQVAISLARTQARVRALQQEKKDARSKADRERAERLIGDAAPSEWREKYRPYGSATDEVDAWMKGEAIDRQIETRKQEFTQAYASYAKRGRQLQSSHHWNAALAGMFMDPTANAASDQWAAMLALALGMNSGFDTDPREYLLPDNGWSAWLHGDGFEAVDSLVRVLQVRAIQPEAIDAVNAALLEVLARTDPEHGTEDVRPNWQRWVWAKNVDQCSLQPSRWIRVRCIEAIGLVGPADSATLEALGNLLTSDDVRIRFEAARALGRIGNIGPDLTGTLKQMAIDDYSALVRETAAWSANVAQ